jgi:uncharacterized repeat protein (TIGR03803 family)
MTFRGYAIGVCGSLLVGCGSLQPPVAPSSSYTSRVSQPNPYASLFSFRAEPDGQHPTARLIPFNGALYGTTSAGGRRCFGLGCGTVFKITASGVETVLYRFRGLPNDGAEPLDQLTLVGQKSYGTTYHGGARCGTHKSSSSGCGTVFEIGASGTVRVLYRFKGVPDGAFPDGSLTLVGSNLYGTTSGGGTAGQYFPHGCGTVFAISLSGKERVLYRFQCQPDGADPTGNLVLLNGTLYGTTRHGGTNNTGTVFAISESGTERVVYSSKGLHDMELPSGLVAMKDILYGSSSLGGPHLGGTVYAVSTNGRERVLRIFSSDKEVNGYSPSGRLVASNGLLYGTTAAGGEPYGGYGTIFSLSPSGKFSILYRFKGMPDGATPLSGVTNVNGTLYGTTYDGGTGGGSHGFGTVFRFAL